MLKKYSRFIALFAFGYQSAFSVLMFVILASALAPEQYSRFSLSFASAQFVVIGFFEWIRLALSRYYRGSTDQTEHDQKKTLYSEYALASGLVLVLGAFVTVVRCELGYPLGFALLVVGQGATDILLSALRFRQKFSMFAATQCFRSTIMIVLSTGTAYAFSAAEGVIAAIAASHLLTVAYVMLRVPELRPGTGFKFDLSNAKAHIRYGFPAAGASVLGLGSVLALRYTIPLVSAPQLVPGILYAFDLMQRPFNVVIIALHSILYPPLVSGFDSGDGRHAYKQLLRIEITAVVAILFLAALALLWIAPIIVDSPLREGFFIVAIPCLIVFGLRSVQANISYLKFHLHKRTSVIALFGATDFMSYGIIILVFLTLGLTDIRMMLWLCAAVTTVQMLSAFYVGKGYTAAPDQTRPGGYGGEQRRGAFGDGS